MNNKPKINTDSRRALLRQINRATVDLQIALDIGLNNACLYEDEIDELNRCIAALYELTEVCASNTKPTPTEEQL